MDLHRKWIQYVVSTEGDSPEKIYSLLNFRQGGYIEKELSTYIFYCKVHNQESNVCKLCF